jgi:hypothetical protein
MAPEEESVLRAAAVVVHRYGLAGRLPKTKVCQGAGGRFHLPRCVHAPASAPVLELSVLEMSWEATQCPSCAIRHSTGSFPVLEMLAATEPLVSATSPVDSWVSPSALTLRKAIRSCAAVDAVFAGSEFSAAVGCARERFVPYGPRLRAQAALEVMLARAAYLASVPFSSGWVPSASSLWSATSSAAYRVPLETLRRLLDDVPGVPTADDAVAIVQGAISAAEADGAVVVNRDEALDALSPTLLSLSTLMVSASELAAPYGWLWPSARCGSVLAMCVPEAVASDVCDRTVHVPGLSYLSEVQLATVAALAADLLLSATAPETVAALAATAVSLFP